jgi:D-alanyl-D-alanine carboxypeptidase/D-alanyl-D-alanine-endopeptidase (penicillin-binding protein 4)
VIVDDRVFDRQWLHPSWPKDQLEKWYCASVCGLNIHTNVLSAFPSPSPDGLGRPPMFTLEPSAPWLDIENKAKTSNTDKNSVWLARGGEGNRFTLFGEVRQPSRQPIEVTLGEVPTFAGQVIAAELVKQGVSVGKGAGRDSAVQAVRLIDANEQYQGRTVAVVSTHMPDILARCNGDSHNLYAECMIKRVGHEVTGEPGSWTNGSSVVRMTITQSLRLGPKFAASTVIVDGSGLSHENRVTPATFTRWLDEMQRDKKIGPEFMDSLATPEKKGGIRRRFQDAKLSCELAAKTGTIDGVRCLSGYLTEPQSGHRVAFSIMVNDMREGDALEALQFHEHVVVAVDHWLAGDRGKAPGGKNAAVPEGSHAR